MYYGNALTTTTQSKIDDARVFVEQHRRAIEAIAIFLVTLALVIAAIAKATAKVIAAIYDRLQRHVRVLVAETVASGKNCRIALCPPKQLTEGAYSDYHDALMATRPNWLIATERARQAVFEKITQWRDRTRHRIETEIAKFLATALGI